MMNKTGGDHRISKAAMVIQCHQCGNQRTYFPQAIRHMTMTPRCAECSCESWIDILGCRVHFGPPAQRQGE
jgi:hypothetical protein